MTDWTVLAPDEWTAEHGGAVAYIRVRRSRCYWQVVRNANELAHGESRDLSRAQRAAAEALTTHDSKRPPLWETVGEESVRWFRREAPRIRGVIVRQRAGTYRWMVRQSGEIVARGYAAFPAKARQQADRIGLACLARIEGREYRAGVAA